MVRKIDWDSQIGRRLKLRDLHVFSTGVQSGSMGEAARQLGASTPAVSEVIANLEHALGVRFWTEAHRASTPRSMAARLSNPVSWWFDELKQSIRDIEFLSDPTVGEVRVACMESLWYTLLPEVILRFSERYPRIEVHAELVGNVRDFPGLRERKYDCLLQRAGLFEEPAIEELNVETLFDDTVVIAAGANSRWARRRKIELAELIDEPWIFGAPDTWHHAWVEEMFRAQGLTAPRPRIITVSIGLRARLLAAGPYLTTLLTSVMQRMRADHYAVTALPVGLPGSTAARIVTLKNRTLSPVVERFLICVREVAASFAAKPAGRAARPRA